MTTPARDVQGDEGIVITWWGSATVELAIGDTTIAIDPYLNPSEPRVDYILLTHADYDHCHDATLRLLTSGDRFRHVYAARTCRWASRLDVPVCEPPGDLRFIPDDKVTVMYPKHVRDPGRQYAGVTEVSLPEGVTIEGVDSSERPARFKSADSGAWPADDGPFLVPGDFPQLGFVITDHRSGLTIYNPGDLHETFDGLRDLRGRIDYMLFPTVKLEGIELTIVETVRPRCVIPVHYRAQTESFPVPLHIGEEDVVTTDLVRGAPKSGVDADLYRDELQRMMRAHWYPTPDPPLARLEEITPQLQELGTEVLVLPAGVPTELAGVGGR